MLAFLLIILCVILPFSIPVQAESMDVWEDFTGTEENCAYLIRHAASGKYLTVANATAEEGAKICLYTADGVADDNTWYIRDGVIVSAMDDMNGEYSAFSKLMLGWYNTFPKRFSPIQIYYPAQGTQTFSIDSITRNGRCLLISKTGHVSDNYFGEYFLLEYVAPEGNAVNSGIGEGGIRIFHVNATLYENYEIINGNYRDYFNYVFCYENYSPIYKGDDKQRVLRLVNDGGEFFTTGDVIDDTTAGFGWYDDNGAESVDTGLRITIGEQKDGVYTVTVETK